MTNLKIKLKPRSHTNRIWGWQGDRLIISVTAAPKDGEANEALIKLLAERFRIPKSSIDIVYGKKTRLKTVKVWNLTMESVIRRMEKIAPKSEHPSQKTQKNTTEK